MQKIYFNPKTNHTIIDVSGIKNPKQIAKEFKIQIEDYQSISVNEKKETISIIKGKLSKKFLPKRNKSII